MESVLGVEITEQKIKILQLNATEKGWEPIHLARMDSPPQSIKDGVIVKPKLIAEKISNYIKENKISTKKTVALINPRFIFTRIIRLPHVLNVEQVRLNLEAELNQYQNFSGKEVSIDFKKLEEVSEEGVKKVNVLFAATFKALAASYLKTMELAGLNLIDIDAPMLSVMRLLDGVDFKSLSLEVTLLMIIGEKDLEICILKGNRPRYLHSLEIDAYDYENNRIAFIDRLVSAIKLVVNFYQVRFIHGEEISRIIINPLETRYSQIQTLLQEKLPRIPIQLSNSLEKLRIDREKDIQLEDLKFSFSGILGAALRLENMDQPFNLNLLFEQRIQRQYHLNQTYLLSFSLAVVLTVMIISFSWVMLKIGILQAKVSRLKSNLEEPSLDLNRAISLKETKDVLQKQIYEATIILRGIKKPLYFNNVAKAMILAPKELWLADIALDKDSQYLVLSGQARTERSIFDYSSSLSSSNYYDSVELVSSKSEADTISFAIKCKTK